jgi:SAM-dependent methyltransferase
MRSSAAKRDKRRRRARFADGDDAALPPPRPGGIVSRMNDGTTADGNAALETTCLVCGGAMRARPGRYFATCGACGFRRSNLKPSIGEGGAATAIDEGARRLALDGLRKASFERALDAIDAARAEVGATTKRLLDVGCAHGWFLKAAATRGYDVLGVEPDPEVAASASAEGVPVVAGFFPDVPDRSRVFDVVTFHDVLEHLPRPDLAARAVAERLPTGGLLALTLPNSKGALFRIADLLDRVGIRGPSDRLWQLGFPSPHLSYFRPDVASALVRKHGFREVARLSLPAYRIKGLWRRLRFDRAASMFACALKCVVLVLLRPLFALAPSDISFQIFEKVAEDAPARAVSGR